MASASFDVCRTCACWEGRDTICHHCDRKGEHFADMRLARYLRRRTSDEPAAGGTAGAPPSDPGLRRPRPNPTSRGRGSPDVLSEEEGS